MRLRRVPTFYFHVCDGGGFFEDEEGRVLPDVKTAKGEAVRGLRDIMAGAMHAGELNLASFIEIEDENHELIATVSIQDAIRLSSEPCQSPRRKR